MLDWNTLNSMALIKYCKGSIVSARIYADVKGNKCPCGGTFNLRVPHPDDVKVIVPKCNACNSYPGLFFIDCSAKGLNEERISPKIRHDQNNSRLDSIFKVLFTLQKIQQEIMDGSFDIRKYDSALARESFKFKNYVKEYIEHHERRLKRAEISPKGLHDKKGLISRELLPEFGNLELSKITHARIKKFHDSYTSKLRTRDLAIGELKCILNQAVRDEMLQVAPKFDPIPRAKKRDEIITRELIEKTIQAMPKQIYKDFYNILLMYPIRPGELRALTWKNVDFTRNEFTVCQHFSKEILLEGRKSIKKDKKEGSITFPMNEDLREIFTRLRTADVVSLGSFVFLSRFGRPFAEASVWEAWNQARRKVGHNFAAYECRHVAASELYTRTNGDLIKMKKAGGWTNTTTLERYVVDTSDMRGLF